MEGATVMEAGTVGSVDVWEEIRLEQTNVCLSIKSTTNDLTCLRIFEPLWGKEGWNAQGEQYGWYVC